jgi:hypothetical protein
LRGEEWVQAVNRLSEGRTVIVINDSCYAEKIEECGRFSSRVIRLHGCRRREQCSEVKLRNGSPAAMTFFRPEREYLEARLGKRMDSASFLAMLLLRASRELMSEGRGAIDYRQLAGRVGSLRDQFDREVIQVRVQHPVACPTDADFLLLQKRTALVETGQ